MLRSRLTVLPVLLGLAACTTPAADVPDAAASGQAPVAVATTTQLGSVLHDITACAGTTSATLMGPGDDPHDFSASSQQVAELVRAKLVVANGLGLEGALTDTLATVAADGAQVYEVAPLLDPLTFEQIEASHEGHDHKAAAGDEHAGHDHGAFDPHVALDAGRMARAAHLIGAELARVTDEPRHAACGDQVAADLRATDESVRQILAAVPAERRVLITDHDAYQYFAQAYRFDIAAVVVPGGSTDAEPSSSEIAGIVDVMRHEQVGAIFSNNAASPRLVQAVAREAGTQVKIVELYTGSVGPAGSGAETYASMMTTNAHRIADALTGA